MQGLGNVANVVDQQTKDEGALVRLVGEIRGDLVCVGSLRSTGLAFHELREGIEGLDGVLFWLGEREVVEGGSWLVQVGQIDEVPAGLEAVAFTLNVVSEGGALREWVIFLLNQVRVVLCEDGKLVKSSGQNVGVVGLKKGLGLSRDEDVSGAEECLGLRGKGSEGED